MHAPAARFSRRAALPPATLVRRDPIARLAPRRRSRAIPVHFPAPRGSRLSRSAIPPSPAISARKAASCRRRAHPAPSPPRLGAVRVMRALPARSRAPPPRRRARSATWDPTACWGRLLSSRALLARLARRWACHPTPTARLASLGSGAREALASSAQQAPTMRFGARGASETACSARCTRPQSAQTRRPSTNACASPATSTRRGARRLAASATRAARRASLARSAQTLASHWRRCLSRRAVRQPGLEPEL